MSLLAKNVLWNLLGQILPAIVAFVSIPFILKGLGTERFGILLILIAILGSAGLLGNGFVLALVQSLSEKLGNKKIELHHSASIIRSTLVILFFISILSSIVLSIFYPQLIKQFLNIPFDLQSETTVAFELLVLIIPCTVITAGLRGVLYAQQSFYRANLVQIPIGIILAVCPLFVIPFSISLVPIFVFILIIQMIALCWYSILLKRMVPQLFSTRTVPMSEIKLLLYSGGWMSVSSVIGPIMLYLDRFVIGSIVSMSAVAFYATPYDFVTKLWIIPASLCGPLLPAASITHTSDRIRTQKIYFKGLKFVFISLMPFILLLTTFSYEGLYYWINPDFASQAYRVSQWLSIGVLINSLAQVSLFMIIAAKRLDIPGKLHLLEFPFYILILFIFVREWGIVGAAWAWVIRVSVDAILIFVTLIRTLAIPIKTIYNILFLSVIVLSILMASLFLSGFNLKVIFLMICLVTGAIFSWRTLLESEDRAWISNFLKFFQLP